MGELLMTRVRVRGEAVRRFIMENVEKHARDIGRFTSDHFKITRQAVNKHLTRLKNEGALKETGKTRNRSYSLAPQVERTHTDQITSDLEEHVLWQNDLGPIIGHQPENVLDIWQYGLTEMINNARDHSAGSELFVMLRKTSVYTEMAIIDNGV